MKNKIIFLLNPNSNEGQAKKKWLDAAKQFSLLPKDPIEVGLSTDFISIIKEKQPEVIAVAGGDGTINTLCNAVLKLPKRPIIAILPFGFGNALAHCLGAETIKKAIDVLSKKPKTIVIDILKTNLPSKEVGIFNISVGFDARIVHIHDNFRYFGLPAFAISALNSFFTHPEKEIKVTIDNVITLNATASSLAIANCPIIGRNYVVSQEAKLNDGLLDCTIFSSKYSYFTNLRLKGFRHPFYSEMGKVHFKAKKIHIEGDPFVQVDGDPVLSPHGFDVEVVPGQLAFLRNSKENIDILYQPFIS